MRIPKAELAVIDVQGLRDYLLSPSHPTDRFKATFFLGLGYRPDNLANLETDVRACLIADAEPAGQNQFGAKFTVRTCIVGSNERAAFIATVWPTLSEDSRPRFVTAYPER